LRGFLALCAFQGAIATTDAQAPRTCAIAETVLDPSGAFGPNAQISLMNEKTGLSRSLSTASEGLFRAALLIPGSYSIKVTAAGFGTQMLRSVPVVASEITSIEFKLRLSDTSTAVANEHFAVAEELQNA
jgi:Carboxypeptidase regulatory-like domain